MSNKFKVGDKVMLHGSEVTVLEEEKMISAGVKVDYRNGTSDWVATEHLELVEEECEHEYNIVLTGNTPQYKCGKCGADGFAFNEPREVTKKEAISALRLLKINAGVLEEDYNNYDTIRAFIESK
jgi:hypothetical protein